MCTSLVLSNKLLLFKRTQTDAHMLTGTQLHTHSDILIINMFTIRHIYNVCNKQFYTVICAVVGLRANAHVRVCVFYEITYIIKS